AGGLQPLGRRSGAPAVPRDGTGGQWRSLHRLRRALSRPGALHRRRTGLQPRLGDRLRLRALHRDPTGGRHRQLPGSGLVGRGRRAPRHVPRPRPPGHPPRRAGPM
ncbi:MAG: hypothetical protein AVDCRST_MAG57-426, partial [uncultured Blastococcus sp.]